MSENELAYVSIAEQSAFIRRKEISPVDLVDLYLERIGKWNKILRSWITACADSARKQAKQAKAEIARGDYRGPLSHGDPELKSKVVYERAARLS